MLTTKAVFQRKTIEFEPKDCIIEKVITLASQEYDAFSENMLDNYDFIRDNKEIQYCDSQGIYHCILVMGEERKDGILVESEGYEYARYSAFLPNADDFLAAAMKQEQVEEKSNVGSILKLKDLIAVSVEDRHLIYSDEDKDVAVICKLKNDTLTPAGKEDWADILEADVQRVFSGSFGIHIELHGVDPQRLSDFSFMLVGQCSKDDYAKWVAEDAEQINEATGFTIIPL